MDKIKKTTLFDGYLVPRIRMSCFSKLLSIEGERKIELEKLRRVVGNRTGKWQLLHNGRSAIENALIDSKISKDHKIGIFTTFGNKYVSSCVTNVVSKFCEYEINEEGDYDAYVIIHQFGRPFRQWDLIDKEKSIIEECAYSMNSAYKTGAVGDYVIFSIPKIANVNEGGLLFSAGDEEIWDENNCERLFCKRRVLHALISKLDKLDELVARKTKIMEEAIKKFNNIGVKLEEIDDIIDPAAIIFTIPKECDAEELKTFLNANGIESSRVYSTDKYFLPCHEGLEESEIDYMVDLVKLYCF